MKKPNLLLKKLEKAKKIAERCDLANYEPARWVKHILEQEREIQEAARKLIEAGGKK